MTFAGLSVLMMNILNTVKPLLVSCVLLWKLLC